MPTINGITFTKHAQILALVNPRLKEVSNAIGVPASYGKRPSELNNPAFRDVKHHTNAVAKRRIAIKFGFKKTGDQAADIIKKGIKRKMAKKKVEAKVGTKSWKELYVMARRSKNEDSRHCVPSGLRRMTKVQLQAYLKKSKGSKG